MILVLEPPPAMAPVTPQPNVPIEVVPMAELALRDSESVAYVRN